MFVLQAAVVKGRGGIATAVAHYERMFRAVGVRSAVLFSGPSREVLRGEGIEVIDAPPLLSSPLAGALPVLGALRAAVLRLAGGEPKAVIVHSDRTLPALQRLFPGAFFVTPCHSDKFKHKKSADLAVTLNAAQDAMARAALPGVRIAQLGNPFVAPDARPLAEPGPPRFNFVGRFTPTKNPVALAAAAGRLSPPPALRFIGGGELEADIRAAVEKAGLTAEFPGWLAAPFSHFHGHDVLVLPSHWEGLPYLLQEALHQGAPIIASDIAGNRAALADGAYGLLFRCGDAGALAEAFQIALGDLDGLRAKAEMGRAPLAVRYGAQAFWRALTAALDIGAE